MSRPSGRHPPVPAALRKRRSYSPAQRIEAISRVLAGESQLAVADSLGFSRTCVNRWCAEQRLVMAGQTSAALSHTARVEPLIAVAEGATRRGFRLIHKRFDDAENEAIPYHDRPRLRDIAYATDISHTAHLDYRDGRKGFEVSVDARSVHLAPLAGLTLEQLQSLAAGGPLPPSLAALEPPAAPTTPEPPSAL